MCDETRQLLAAVLKGSSGHYRLPRPMELHKGIPKEHLLKGSQLYSLQLQIAHCRGNLLVMMCDFSATMLLQ